MSVCSITQQPLSTSGNDNNHMKKTAITILAAAMATFAYAGHTEAKAMPQKHVTVTERNTQSSDSDNMKNRATTTHAEETASEIKKILFIGDSMTGWMAERLNAYGDKNGFEVATVVWDGSTMSKWASSPSLQKIIDSNNPDAVFVCLGMNELFETRPETRLKASLDKIKNAIGDRQMLWIGPPSWPGHNGGKAVNDFLAEELGSGHFFRSSDLQLARQSKSNPHPTKTGIIKWIDSVIAWIPDNTVLCFKSLDNPGPTQMSRGKIFIYKRMKEKL